MKRAVFAVAVLSAVSFTVTIIALIGWSHYSNQIDTVVASNCAATEDLKKWLRESAQATITGDEAFLKAHPGGTADFPEAVVRQDIANKQRTLERFAVKPCL